MRSSPQQVDTENCIGVDQPSPVGRSGVELWQIPDGSSPPSQRCVWIIAVVTSSTATPSRQSLTCSSEIPVAEGGNEEGHGERSELHTLAARKDTLQQEH
jgi:hypothetical protein